MSYGAGSVGLNLQFCEYVFLFDRWWNPAVEDQAINRAHRIGVAGPVTVTRFVTSGTIEERIDQILAQKRELFEAILADTQSPRAGGCRRPKSSGSSICRYPVAAWIFPAKRPDGTAEGLMQRQASWPTFRGAKGTLPFACRVIDGFPHRNLL